MICYKGKVLTVDSNDTVAGYLVEDKGRIVYVGNELPEQYKNVQTVELGKKVLVPAFVDTHQHMASFSTFHAGLNVMDAESNEEIAQMVKEFVQSSGNKKTLIAFGASPYSVKEGRLISRKELDKVCPDKEIMVVKYDGHACIINSRLLDKLKGKVSKLRGYHEDTGEMNQEAFFECSNYITNSLSIIDLFKNMQSAIDFQASHGIGCIHTVSGVGFTGNLDITFEKIFAKSLTNGYQVRVFPQSMNVDVALKRKLPRIGGCFECALDGCFGSHDAAMNEPYVDSLGGDGVLYYDDEKVIDFCKKANRAGLQIEIKHLTRHAGHLRRHSTIIQEKTTDMELYMTVFQLKRELRYAGTIIYRCLYRVLSLTGNRNLMSILKALWVKKERKDLIRSEHLMRTE